MTPDDEFAVESKSPAAGRGSLLRFNLFTLLLAMAVFAVWMAWYLTLQETARMQASLSGLRNLARELRINSPDWYAAVQHHELTDDDFRWRVYLPPDNKYQLCVATQNVDQAYDLKRPKPEASMIAPIAPGEHELMLTYEKEEDEWTIAVTVDGQIILEEKQPADWNLGRGSSGGSLVQKNRHFTTDEPLKLFDRVFFVPLPNKPNSASSKDSNTGLRLWVEKLKK
ncbi:hypothetical protein [Blastopirellula retiformator]|uniref:Uncharacterized protein n=1 Tax=Blastopirellula retiformator TaxID=2527970 RepID=A0A5C5V0D9_9BACT|nr:hypothetical protein [Blastopirellula retiformator]TWT31841.1 hypothetical protein Enr8_37660 [Blastopirellula retiformator]